MKKRFPRALLASILALLLVASSGCAAAGPEDGTSSVQSAESAKEESQAQDSSKEGGETKNTGENTMPFVEPGTVTLTYAGPDSWYPPASYAQDLPVWQEVEKRTGVKIKWEVMPADQYNTAMQTRLAGGSKLPDIMAVPPLWGGDVVKLANNGIIIPLKSLIEENGPNILQMYEKYPVVKKIHTAPDGEIYNFSEVFVEGNEVAPKSLILRKDWLDALSLEVPKTIDDWYQVLKDFKEKDPNGNGQADEIPIATHDGLSSFAYFGPAFGLPAPAPALWADESGKVEYMYTKPAYKELLVFANKLYTEGLMDPQYSTNNDEAKLDAMVSKNLVGTSAHFAGVDVRWDNLLKNAGTTGADNILIAPPVGPNGEAPKLSKRNPTGMEYAVTKDCANPDIAVKWIDYISASDEGVILTHFGIEGKSFERDENGRPKFTEWTTNNPDGLDPFSAVRSLGAFPSLFDTQTKEFMSQSMQQKSIDACVELFPLMVEPYPRALSTAEEASRLTSITADMDTYVKEMIQKFVMGTESLDNFDKFVSQLNAMGLEEYVKINQEIYDRFSKA